MLLSVSALGATQLKTLQASKGSQTEQGSSENGNAEKDLSQIIRTVDQLYDANEMEKALAFLERYSDSKEAEILWRLARLTYKVYYGCHEC